MPSLEEKPISSDADKAIATSAHILGIGMGWFPATPGGLDRYVYELTHHLATGLDHIELCGIGLPQDPSNLPVKLTNLASPDSPLWKRLWDARTHFSHRQSPKPDAINIHFALYGFPLIGVLPKDIPITFTFHGPWALESQQEGAHKLGVLLKYWVEQRVFQRCDRFIVLSQAFGNILHQHYQVPWSKIHIIPGGVNLTQFQPSLSRQQAREQLGWSQDRMILFTPRRLVHRMGLEQLLRALHSIKTQIPEVWLAIAGKGPLQSTLEQQVRDLELQDHVKLLGFLPDEQLAIAYQAADLSVMPSQSLEGFGLVLLESLACGTPVLCTPIGGMPEVLEPFSPNLITQSAREADIAERLDELLTGKVPLPSRTACRAYISAHFDWQRIAQQVRQVLLN
jgi:glycosyltransferase involved in cell wall biosynthesis